MGTPGSLAGRIARSRSFLEELKTDRGLWFLIYFAVVLAYLLLNQGGSIDLERHPVWAFRAFAFGGLLVFSIIDSKRIRDGLQRVNFAGVLPVAVIALLVISNVVSIRPFETVEETMNVLAYAALAFLCYTYINSLSKLRQFLEIVLVAGFLIAFHGLYIFYGALWSHGETRPLSGLFYWHNPCAGFLLLIWPTMLAQFYALRRGWQTFLVLYIFYFTFTAFMLTLSRGGWLAGFLPFLLIPFVLSRRKLMVSWRPIVLIVLYFISALPIIMRFRGRFLQPIIDRWNQLRLDDYSVVGRFEFWDIAWRVFLKHPWFGIGFNTFGYYYVHYQKDPQYYTKDPHNVYLRFLVEGGAVGAIVIVSMIVIVIKLILRTLKEGPEKMLTVYRVGLLAGVGGELLHMAIDFDWTFPVIPCLLLCETAVVSRSFTYPRIEQELTIDQWEPEYTEPRQPDEPDEQDKPAFAPGMFLKPLIVWQIVAALLFAMNISGYVSMNLYDKGKDLIENQARLAVSEAEEAMSQIQMEMVRASTQEAPTMNELLIEKRSEIIQEAMRYWQKSLVYNPWNWYPLKDLVSSHYYGLLDLREGGSDIDPEPILRSALSYADRLLRVTPHRPATHYYAGQLRILAGRIRNDDDLIALGLENILHSIELDPVNIPKYYLGIAEFYRDEGDLQTALRYLRHLEKVFVPLYPNGDVDFGALRGKSLARQDWVDITETCRQAWWMIGEIEYELGNVDESLEAFYNGLNTPLGGGEMVEQYLDLELLHLPFALRIAEIEAEQGNWLAVAPRAKQAIEIMKSHDMLGTQDSRKAHQLYYAAREKIGEQGQTEGSGTPPDQTDITS